MNFQNLQRVEYSQKYLDIAFNTAKKKAGKTREKTFKNRFAKSKSIEIERVKSVRKVLCSNLKNITNSFPFLGQLHEFYQELVKITIDYAKFKKSLGAVNWAVNQIEKLYRIAIGHLSATQDIGRINCYRREFYGRASSVLKQINNELVFLEECRKILKGFPAIKTSLPTVCIFGFPNVGKSTLLSKLTASTPEIKNYAFTTKKINMGYMEYAHKKIQFIDTPGSLDRFEKMNAIEQQAFLALKHCANVIIYVFDPTESYPLERQTMLYERIRTLNIPVICYISKTDLVDVDLREFRRKFNIKEELINDKKILIEEIAKILKM